MTYSNSEILPTPDNIDSSEQETQYILNNPALMGQVNQVKRSRKATSLNALQEILDVEYILSNPDLIEQIQLLVETSKRKKYESDSVSGRYTASL